MIDSGQNHRLRNHYYYGWGKLGQVSETDIPKSAVFVVVFQGPDLLLMSLAIPRLMIESKNLTLLRPKNRMQGALSCVCLT